MIQTDKETIANGINFKILPRLHGFVFNIANSWSVVITPGHKPRKLPGQFDSGFHH
jgi:hypothetical protein